MKKLIIPIFTIGAGLFVVVSPVHAGNDEPELTHKVFVCKYVGTPGDDERLQTGQNPISVDAHSLRNFVGIGSFFNDAQGRSIAIAFDVGQGEPSVDNCPQPTVRTTTTTEETLPSTTSTLQSTTSSSPPETSEGSTSTSSPVITAGRLSPSTTTDSPSSAPSTSPATGAPTTVATPEEGLPVTGNSTWVKLLIAAGIMGLGVAASRFARRSNPRLEDEG